MSFMRRRSGQKGGETAKHVETARLLVEAARLLVEYTQMLVGTALLLMESASV